MTTNDTTMTQSKREGATSIDISQPIDKIQTPNNKPMVTKVTWDPVRSAAEAQARVESQVREAHRRQVERERNDPTLNRILNLEAKMDRIEHNLATLLSRIEGGNVQ